MSVLLFTACNETVFTPEQEAQYTKFQSCLFGNDGVSEMMISGQDSEDIAFEDATASSLADYSKKHNLDEAGVVKLLQNLELFCMSLDSYQMIQEDKLEPELTE